MKDVEYFKNKDELYAIILRDDYHKDGISFFTDDYLSQQLAYMSHPKGKIIDPHIHKNIERQVFYTQEVLLIKEGKLKVNFFDDNKEYLESRILNRGDVILLIKGGHGFEVIESLKMIEIKQGPYLGDSDKIRF
jgi:mannose-6-phosphate isomerase-like protein (cupin superfamily)|tara:strand:+ start:173 stop:574 length:402 start_codon:yes stop_codon:yes gene_type:complete